MERCERELEQERKMRSVLESNIKKIAKSDQVHCKSLVLTFDLNVPDIYLMYTNLHLVNIFFHLFALFV